MRIFILSIICCISFVFALPAQQGVYNMVDFYRELSVGHPVLPFPENVKFESGLNKYIGEPMALLGQRAPGSRSGQQNEMSAVTMTEIEHLFSASGS
jgi:hypothetical protein